jgi:hypothetical protein
VKRHFVFASVLAITLFGCGGDADEGNTDGFVKTTKAVKAPEWDISSDLALFADSQSIHVGDSVSDAESVFRKPEGRAAAFRDLPPGFGPGYRSIGWSTEAEGFGVISLEGRVVVAVHSEYGVSESRSEQVVNKYLRRYGSRFKRLAAADGTDLEPSWVQYWFAEQNKQRLLVCAVRMKDGFVNVTESVGWAEAMDALRMSPKNAMEDLAKLKAKSTAKPAGVKS